MMATEAAPSLSQQPEAMVVQKQEPMEAGPQAPTQPTPATGPLAAAHVQSAQTSPAAHAQPLGHMHGQQQQTLQPQPGPPATAALPAQPQAGPPQSLQHMLPQSTLQQPEAQLGVAAADPGSTDSGLTKKKVTAADIQLVQNLIERCLQLYMSQKEVVQALAKQAKIDEGFTDLVWQKLEEQNPEFFRSYYTRLKLKDQIIMFNHVLEQQVQMVQRLQRMYWLPQPVVSGPPSGPPGVGPAGPYGPGMRPGMAPVMPMHAQQPMSGAPGAMMGPYGMPAHPMFAPGGVNGGPLGVPGSSAPADHMPGLGNGDAMKIDGTGGGSMDPLFPTFGSDNGAGPSSEGMPGLLSPDISLDGLGNAGGGRSHVGGNAATPNLGVTGMDTLDLSLPKNFSFSDLHLDGDHDLMGGVQGDGAAPSGLGMRRDFSLSELAPLDMGDVPSK